MHLLRVQYKLKIVSFEIISTHFKFFSSFVIVLVSSERQYWKSQSENWKVRKLSDFSIRFCHELKDNSGIIQDSNDSSRISFCFVMVLQKFSGKKVATIVGKRKLEKRRNIKIHNCCIYSFSIN